MLSQFSNISKMMGQLKDMQQQVEKIKEKLNTLYAIGESEDQTVRIKINGNRQLTDLELSDAFPNLSKENMQYALYSAFKKALSEAESIHEKEMSSAAGSMLPNLGGMFK